MGFRQTYRSAVVCFCEVVAGLPADRWDGPGLGEWSLRELAGHTVSSALRQVPAVLATSGATLSVDSPEGFWIFAHAVPPKLYAAAVAASSTDARATGMSLGDDPAAVIRDLAGRATQALAEVGDDDIVTTPVGGMRVRDWLPTRTFELVVHGMDLAAAAGVPIEFAPEVVAETAAMAARVAVGIGDGPLLVRALTGRAALPPGYSTV